MASIFPTGLRNGIKGLDANRYATKKTVAQGMLDIALLTSNASQLKYVLQVGPRHEFYMLLLILISVSIVLQLLVGLLFVVIGGLDLNDDTDQPSAIVLNDVIVIFIFVISVINIVISAFGIEYSNNPLVLERLKHINNEYLRTLNASAGILAIIISNMDGDHSLKQKKIADLLYHISVAMMTIVVFCDVIKMTFGLDPALSEQDHFSNKTQSIYDAFLNVFSAVACAVLGFIYDLNHQPHQRTCEILNNLSLLFKCLGTILNVVISIFYSIAFDNVTMAL